MAGVNGNSVVFTIVEQTAIDSGVPTSPTWDIIPHTGGDIDDTIGTTTSNLVDTTRQAARPVLTSIDVGAQISSELQVKETVFQNIVKGALQNQFGSDINYTASTISFDNATSEIRDSADGFTDIDVGEYFVPYGSLINQKAYLVTAKADDGTLTVSPTPEDEAEGTSITIKGKHVTSGNNEIAYTAQKRITGSDGVVYYTFEGMQVASVALSITPQSLITTDVNFVGLQKRSGTSQIASSTDNPEPTDRVLGTVSGVPQIFMDNVSQDPADVLATDLSFTIDNGSSGVPVVGAAGAACIQHDAISVTGTFNTYVGNTVSQIVAEKLKATNQTEFQFAIAFKDVNDNYAVFDFPTIQYTSLTNPENENGSLLSNTGTFSASGKNDAGYTVRCTIIEAP
jgi:hypothetical protein